MRGVCDQLAENGVIAIAPDLLSGQTYADVDGARKGDLRPCTQGNRSRSRSGCDFCLRAEAPRQQWVAGGFVEFCWGGGWTFNFTANMNPKLKAAYSFYGTAAD